MRRSSLVLASVLVVGVAGVGQAQLSSPQPPTIFEATPYAGVIVFGDYLSGPLGTSITNAPATIIGAQLGMKVTPNISIIGNVATASSDIQAGIPILGGVSIAQSTVQMFDAGLQLELPITALSGFTFSPILQAGAGAMRYAITESFITTNSTNFAANVAAGADISVGRGVGVRFMAKDYIGNFDMQQATYIDAQTNTTHSFAFSAGLRFSF
jgi:outer membrane protein with beta-barrel domain